MAKEGGGKQNTRVGGIEGKHETWDLNSRVDWHGLDDVAILQQ